MPRISKRIIATLQPAEKDYIVWDDQVAGFALRVWPSGRMSYVVHYRTNGRFRRYTIGHHGPWTADKARDEAIRILARVKNGGDPNVERGEERSCPTVSQFSKTFVERHVNTHLKPTTQAEYKRAIDLFIAKKIGNRKMDALTHSDVVAFHHTYRHIPYQANRTLGVLSKMFSLAILWGVRKDNVNPCRGVKRYKELKRERYLTAEEHQRLGQALDDARSTMPKAVNALQLLLLTGCRLREVQRLKWEYVHLDEGVIRLPDTKNGARTVQLGESAVGLLGGIPRVEGNPYVITGRKEGGHLTDLEKPWRRIRKEAGLEDVRIHDLRHSFASDALELGEDLIMIGKLLGHRDLKSTARYAHLKKEPIQRAVKGIDLKISAALSTTKATPVTAVE
ncbi:site-specific integrase [Acetobacter malorum]|nr:site-specific integrase [Acetobacter malorum]